MKPHVFTLKNSSSINLPLALSARLPKYILKLYYIKTLTQTTFTMKAQNK